MPGIGIKKTFISEHYADSENIIDDVMITGDVTTSSKLSKDEMVYDSCHMTVSKKDYYKYHYDMEFPYGKYLQYLTPCITWGKECGKMVSHVDYIRRHNYSNCVGAGKTSKNINIYLYGERDLST